MADTVQKKRLGVTHERAFSDSIAALITSAISTGNAEVAKAGERKAVQLILAVDETEVNVELRAGPLGTGSEWPGMRVQRLSRVVELVTTGEVALFRQVQG